MIDAALYQRLVAFVDLSALIGNRVYPVSLPENVTLPALTLSKVSGNFDHLFGADSALVNARYTLLAHSEVSPAQAKAVAKQARLAVQRYRGTLDATVVQDIFIENDGPDFYDPTSRTWYSAVDIEVHYLE